MICKLWSLYDKNCVTYLAVAIPLPGSHPFYGGSLCFVTRLYFDRTFVTLNLLVIVSLFLIANTGNPYSVNENNWKLRFTTLKDVTANQQHSQPADQVFSIERKESPSWKDMLEYLSSSTGTDIQEKNSDQVRQEEFLDSDLMLIGGSQAKDMTSHVSARIPPNTIFSCFLYYFLVIILNFNYIVIHSGSTLVLLMIHSGSTCGVHVHINGPGR